MPEEVAQLIELFTAEKTGCVHLPSLHTVRCDKGYHKIMPLIILNDNASEMSSSKPQTSVLNLPNQFRYQISN